MSPSHYSKNKNIVKKKKIITSRWQSDQASSTPAAPSVLLLLGNCELCLEKESPLYHAEFSCGFETHSSDQTAIMGWMAVCKASDSLLSPLKYFKKDGLQSNNSPHVSFLQKTFTNDLKKIQVNNPSKMRGLTPNTTKWQKSLLILSFWNQNTWDGDPMHYLGFVRQLNRGSRRNTMSSSGCWEHDSFMELWWKLSLVRFQLGSKHGESQNSSVLLN